MNAFTPFSPVTLPSENIDRLKRHRRQMDQLRRAAEALMLSNRDVHHVGPHDEVAELAAELGLQPHEFCSFDVRVAGRRACLVCVPSRLWHKPEVMEVFHELKVISNLHGYHVILVPESFIRRQPRLDNAFLVAGTADAKVSPTDRMCILAHLIENDSATLYELSGLVRHGDPISCVLHLVTTGALQLDLNSRITPHSLVQLSPDR